MSGYRVWECQVCNWVYDEAKGCPEEGLAAGTRWEDVPDDWACPECGVDKSSFEMQDITPSTITKDETTDSTVNDAPIVIIGSGIAAYTIVKESRKLDTNTDIVIYTKDDGAFYSKPKLSNSLSKNLTAQEIASARAEQQSELYRLTVHTFTEVSKIDTQNKRIEVTGSNAQLYSKLILATGAQPRKLTLEGSAADDVFSINNLLDYQKFQTQLQTGDRVAIIGAGLVGCEFADDLTQGGYQVEIIDPSQLPLSSLIPPHAGQQMLEHFVAAGIRFHFKATAKSLNKTEMGYRLTLNTGDVIETERVLSAIGLTPNTKLASAAGIKCEHGIVVDEQLQTSVDSIYALGDCAEVAGTYLPYIDPIIPQARTLARVLIGEDAKLAYEPMPVYVKSKLYPTSVITPANKSGKWVIDQDDETGLVMRNVSDTGDQLGFVVTMKASARAYELAQKNK